MSTVTRNRGDGILRREKTVLVDCETISFFLGSFGRRKSVVDELPIGVEIDFIPGITSELESDVETVFLDDLDSGSNWHGEDVTLFF